MCVIIVLAIIGVVVLIYILSSRQEKRDQLRKAQEEQQQDALAEEGDGEAQFNRGKYYINRNVEKAKYWFEKAVTQGFSKAKRDLELIEIMKKEGCSMIQKGGEGEKLFDAITTMAMHGPNRAQNFVRWGEIVENGCLMRKNDPILYLTEQSYWSAEERLNAAAVDYKDAADLGDSQGVENLYRVAGRYYFGDGLEKPNKKRAHELLLIVASYGHADAKSDLLKLDWE